MSRDEWWDAVADWFVICMAGFFFGGALSAIVLACCGCSSAGTIERPSDGGTEAAAVYGDAGLILAPSPPTTVPAADTSEPAPAASGGAGKKLHP